jgi:hypothetical protein
MIVVHFRSRVKIGFVAALGGEDTALRVFF